MISLSSIGVVECTFDGTGDTKLNERVAEIKVS